MTGGPKKLFLDIETFPMTGTVWTLWDARVLEVLKHSVIVGFSAKWEGGEHVTRVLPDYEGYAVGSEDDRPIVAELRELLHEADIVVAHNGRKFDCRRINARITKHRIPPPSPYLVNDTLETAKRFFGFPSNRLDDLGEYLGLGRKHSTGGYELWQRCMRGDAKAWEKMRRYNRQDVVLLEKVYRRLLPWDQRHPNVGVFTGISSCPKCGSMKLQARGRQVARTRTYQRLQCQTCGSWSRSSEMYPQRTAVVNVAS